MMACEQGSFDVTTALAGQLGTTVVAAHSIMLNIVALTFVSAQSFAHIRTCIIMSA